jgi:hypothetical protein
MGMGSDQVKDAAHQARVMVATVMTVPVITLTMVVMQLIRSSLRSALNHGRQHARKVALQHIYNSHKYAGANALQ